MASSSSAAAKRMITLKSLEGELFEVDEKVAMESQTIMHMIEDGCADNAIPLPNVNAPTLAKVIEYCKRHVEAAAAQIDAPSGSSEAKAKQLKDANAELKAWDAEFVDLDQSDLLELILAANYLNIEGLLKLMCQTVANMIKGKSAEEIRATFNIISDFTPEEEEEIRRENAWAFE